MHGGEFGGYREAGRLAQRAAGGKRVCSQAGSDICFFVLTLFVSKIPCSPCHFHCSIAQIVDAKKAVTMLAQEGNFNPASVYRTITDKSKLALSIIIGNNRLNRTFKSTTGPTVESKAAGAEDPEEGDANSFKQHVHDVFMQGFSEDMLSVCGVKVCDMSVEDVRITNPELAQAMARGAVARTGLEQAKINGAVRDAEAAAEQRAAVTAAEGQARAMRILATAESERITQLDQAMGSVGPVTQQRELIRAAGEVMAASKATLVLGQNIGDVARMMGSGQGGLTSLVQQQ